MKVKVVALPEIREYFKELIHILHEKEYFGFEENAIEYVESLFEDIKTTLPQRSKKQAPAYFSRYGKDMYYSSFKKNKATQWYVFFTIYIDQEQDEQIYLIRYVSNNHVMAQYL